MVCFLLGTNNSCSAGKSMASFYHPSLSSEGDMLPSAYLLNQKQASYPSPAVENNKVYMSQPSVSLSYPNLLSGGALSAHDLVGGESNSILSNESLHSNGSDPIQRCHELSLTLGSQEPSLVQMHSDVNQYTGAPNFHPLLSSDVQSELHLSQNNSFKNAQYVSFDFTAQMQDTVRYSVANNIQDLINSKGTSFLPSHASEFTGSLCNSKYLRAARDLLDELVSVHRAPKQSEKVQSFNSFGQGGSAETDLKRDKVSAELPELTNTSCPDLSPSERHDLQNKVTKLFGMLDEVDRRYKQYCYQMQVVVSSFNTLAGHGAAHTYTALALRTISQHFRCLHDAIKKQIQAAQKSLGEQDVGPNGMGVLSRLRYVDQQLRQQKALQQYGVMRQPWRPQRGLPESAVSVLRAWLFEHFLHPYPKDSEKIVLGRQTGLTRSQVANWFINARVRLWKPMIEEMYKEEFGDAETEAKSSSEHATTAQEMSAVDNREQAFQGSLMSPASDGNHRMHTNDFSLIHMQPGQQIINMVGNSIFPDNNASVNTNILPTADKHDNQITKDASMNQVSLALGLQNSEELCTPMPDEIQQKGIDGSSSSSIPLDKLDYYYVDQVNNQHRFANTHLLSDFVS